MTRVLPLPAPARISTGPSVVSTASRCWGLRSLRNDKLSTALFHCQLLPIANLKTCQAKARKSRSSFGMEIGNRQFLSTLTLYRLSHCLAFRAGTYVPQELPCITAQVVIVIPH